MMDRAQAATPHLSVWDGKPEGLTTRTDLALRKVIVVWGLERTAQLSTGAPLGRLALSSLAYTQCPFSFRMAGIGVREGKRG